MDDVTRQGLEALLFVVDEPMDVPTMSDLLACPEDEVTATLEAIARDYEATGRGLTVREVAGGWRMYTSDAAAPVVERYVLAGRSGRLTQAALETLAVVAYKQPISRQEIGDIRGVNADGAVRSLVARGFVEEAGRDEGPGQAILYGTTTAFLEKLGLRSLDELPPLTDFLPEAPAPDEPGLDHVKEARRRLASGLDLPSTGAGWRPGGDEDADADEDGPGRNGTGDEGLLPPVRGRVDQAADDGEMDELTAALERAARSAMDQLREAVAAAERDEADGDEAGDGDGDEDRDEESTHG